ncbi:MAG: hypothetical protein R3F33_08615 [Planctomycetota bacterium]
MKAAHLRPVFKLPTDLTPDEASARLEALLTCQDCRVAGQAVKHHMMLTLTDRERHFWSPWLQLEIRTEVGREHTMVYGRFSPAPSIWMGFALTYLALGTISMFATIFAVSQWMLDTQPSALWALPICALIAATIWTATRIGQGMARQEMVDLQAAVEAALEREPVVLTPASAPSGPAGGAAPAQTPNPAARA